MVILISDLKFIRPQRVITPIKPALGDLAECEWPSRFQRKKTCRGETAPESNKNFKTMPKGF